MKVNERVSAFSNANKKLITELRGSDKVEFAKPVDIPTLVAFSYKTFHDFDMKLSEPSMDKILTRITNEVIHGVPLVYKEEEKILGCLLLKNGTPWWSEEKFLSSFLFYVLPEARKKRVAFYLLQSAKEYSKLTKTKVGIDLIGGESLERKEKLLEYLGFDKVNSVFVTQGD